MPPKKKKTVVEENITTEQVEDKELAKFKAIYGELMDLTDTEDHFFPSGSLVVDSVISNGRGIPLGKFISLNSESGCGKCVSGDTIINLNGVYQRIDEGEFLDGYTPFEGNILTLGKTDKTSHKYKEDVDFTFRITDQYGMTIQCTPEHPLLVLHSNLKEEWVKAKDIKLGDKIIGQGFIYKKPQLDPVFYMKGVYLADGSTSGFSDKGNPVITTLQDESSYIKNILKQIGFSYQEPNQGRLKENTYTTLLCERSGKRTIEYLRFSKVYKPSFVTKRFYEPMTYNQLLSKIAGLLDTDAYISNHNIDFCQKDKEIITNLQKFLSMLGIVGKLSEKYVRKVNKTYYRLSLNLKYSKLLASLEIGLVQIVGDKLNSILQHPESSSKNIGNSSESRETFSVDKDTILEKKKHIKDRSYRSRLNSIARLQSISSYSLKELYENNLISTDYSKLVLHEVCCKEELINRISVYDYTIPDSHSFLANGLVSHNTTMCIHIARNCCAKGYRCLYIDTECGLNPNQIKNFSLTPFVENRTFIPKHIQTYRELDNILKSALTDDSLKFIFIDSLTDIIPDQLIENNVSDINQPALEAVLQSRILKKYKYLMNEAGKTVFFVLQNRTKIAMSYGQQTTVGEAGGKSVQYHMDIRLELKKIEDIKKSVKGHDKPIPLGSRCYLKANKNRYAPPFIPMEIHILFGKGVSNSGAIASALILNGIAKQPNNKKYTIDYQGEEKEFLGRPKFEEFIKDHLSYYKEIIESYGGIKLLQESDEIRPIEENVEDSIENSLDSSNVRDDSNENEE